MRYLSRQAMQKLDEAVKKFEVALRSYIADTLIQRYPTLSAFKNELSQIRQNSAPFAKLHRFNFQPRIADMIGNASKYYSLIEQCEKAYNAKKFDNSVPFVSDLVSHFAFFHRDVFQKVCLENQLGNLSEVVGLLTKYNKIRNDLAHPASRLVSENDASTIMNFMLKLLKGLDSSYFWYAQSEEILGNIIEVKAFVSGLVLKKENLRSVSSSGGPLVCREEELSLLHDLIVGKENYQRVAGSVAVFGYGGIGKTALVLEFLNRLIKDIIDTGNKFGLDFILFLSSKDEFLEVTKTTGEFYIEKTTKQIDSLKAIVDSVCATLELDSIEKIKEKYRRGIIVIDNIENIEKQEMEKIFEFIRSVPRDIQFIVTSRNEESCEEKIHIKEFSDQERGSLFINRFVESESLNYEIQQEFVDRLVSASKGNTLILVQSLRSLCEGVVTPDQLIKSLEQVKTKSSEIIADFMYKNTFESAIVELSEKQIDAGRIIVTISLYAEPIDLYSISKLCGTDIGTAEDICLFLSKRMILVKGGEFFSLNEFAKKFIFIKLLPDRVETARLLESVRLHKARMQEKLKDLDVRVERNATIVRTMRDWQPRNYIDKIIIAETFNLYRLIEASVRRSEISKVDRLVAEFKENELITNHPYIQFQKARIFQKLLELAGEAKKAEYFSIISRAYEDCIETIEFDYSYIKGTESNAAILMLYGIFLLTRLSDYGKAVRYLEQARESFLNPLNKNYFDARLYLVKAYLGVQRQRNSCEYDRYLIEIVAEMSQRRVEASRVSFDIGRFLKTIPQKYKRRGGE